MFAVCEQEDGFNCGVYLCRYLYAFIRTTATEQFQDFTYSQMKKWNQGHIHQFENTFFQFDHSHIVDLRLKFTVMTVNLVRSKMEWQPKESRKSSEKHPMQVRKSKDELKEGKSPMQKCTQQAPLCKKIALDIDQLERESIDDSDNEIEFNLDLAVQENDSEQKSTDDHNSTGGDSGRRTENAHNHTGNDGVCKETVTDVSDGRGKKIARINRVRDEDGSDDSLKPPEDLIDKLEIEAKEEELSYFVMPQHNPGHTRLEAIKYLKRCKLDLSKAKEAFVHKIRMEYILASTGCDDYLQPSHKVREDNVIEKIKSIFTEEPDKVKVGNISDARLYCEHFGDDQGRHYLLVCEKHKRPYIGVCPGDRCFTKVCTICLDNCADCPHCRSNASKGQEDIAGTDPSKENDIEHKSGIDGNSEKDSPSKVLLLANDADKKKEAIPRKLDVSSKPIGNANDLNDGESKKRRRIANCGKGDESPKEPSQNESDDQDDEHTTKEENFCDKDKYRKSKFFVIFFSSPYFVAVSFSA